MTEKVITLSDRHGQPAPVQPPPSYEPEQSLLGAILVRPEVFPAVIDAGVKAESFSGAAHGLIFKAMLALHGEKAPIDLVTVTTRLKECGKLEAVGGPVFLAGLSEQVGFATNAGYYSHLVRTYAWRREYRETILQLNSIEQNPAARPDDLVTLLSSKLADLEASCPGNYSQKNRLISLEELLAMKFPEQNELIGGGIWPAVAAPGVRHDRKGHHPIRPARPASPRSAPAILRAGASPPGCDPGAPGGIPGHH